MDREIIIGTRGSKLALWQAHWVKFSLERFAPEHTYRIVTIKTVGDRFLDTSLAKIGDKGLFTKELELALLEGEIHMAAHSVKDLPTVMPHGLKLGAVCPREMPNDTLISRQGKKLRDLPQGAVVGTGSLRRRAQLAHIRPDLRMADLRGNVNTRLDKLESGLYDAIILAWAGLKRLGLVGQVTEVLPPGTCMPAVGQGAIGVEIPAGEDYLQEIAGQLDHPETHCAVTAERAFLRRIEGGCQAPVGALGTASMGHLLLEGVVARLDGSRVLRASVVGKTDEADTVGKQLALKMIEMGAGELLEECRRESGGYDA